MVAQLTKDQAEEFYAEHKVSIEPKRCLLSRRHAYESSPFLLFREKHSFQN